MKEIKDETRSLFVTASLSGVSIEQLLQNGEDIASILDKELESMQKREEAPEVELGIIQEKNKKLLQSFIFLSRNTSERYLFECY